MSSTAKMIEDSLAPNGKRLMTMQLRYPRLVHSEFMTHRDFSRNASSSRATPVEKTIAQVRNDPAMPIHWGANQPGMQAREEVADIEGAKALWLDAAGLAATKAEQMMKIGLHKQVANRILEPFQYISVIVSATEWDNFFALRDHPDADPNIYDLAQKMKAARNGSTPRKLTDDPWTAAGWHLPYITGSERIQYSERPHFLAQLSTARNARVSYLTHDGQWPDADKDLALFKRLVGGVPIHASPTEHPGYPLPNADDRCKNFVGFHQYRADVEAELFMQSTTN